MKLVYVHINDKQPPLEYTYTSIYQSCVVSDIPIVVLTNDHHVETVKKRISKMDISNDTMVVGINSVDKNFNKSSFRNNFWRHTTERFFVIQEHIHEPFVHIENDVLLYSDPLQFTFPEGPGLYIVKDSPNRGIGSIIFATPNEFDDFVKYAQTQLSKNDMEILGGYSKAKLLNADPEKCCDLVYDGAAFGQYIAGIDPRNLSQKYSELLLFNNKSIGFVNETSVVKPNRYIILRKLVEGGLFKYYIKHKSTVCNLFNLHIHSKHLAPYTSTFDLNFNDIITGDRVLSLCDIVFCTRDTLSYHQNLQKFNKEVIVINDYKNINVNNLYRYIGEIRKQVLKIHVYTHALGDFIKYIFPYLEMLENKYIFYMHNSDHSFDERYTTLLNSPNVLKVYSQNVAMQHSKLHLLPIGVANSMFKHGDLLTLYKTMSVTFINKKEKNIFASALGNSHLVRKLIDLTNFEVSPKLDYNMYLYELSRHYFCLCPRGNGMDTHRFWEALYLGVIPVVINTVESNCRVFVEYLRESSIPFFEITDLIFFKKNTPKFFDKDLYNSILGGKYLQNCSLLKLCTYSSVS